MPYFFIFPFSNLPTNMWCIWTSIPFSIFIKSIMRKIYICPRTPEGGQSVKATFLMRKTSKKGAKRFCFMWAFAKRPYITYSKKY